MVKSFETRFAIAIVANTKNRIQDSDQLIPIVFKQGMIMATANVSKALSVTAVSLALTLVAFNDVRDRIADRRL
jgi:hypothetical protein